VGLTETEQEKAAAGQSCIQNVTVGERVFVFTEIENFQDTGILHFLIHLDGGFGFDVFTIFKCFANTVVIQDTAVAITVIFKQHIVKIAAGFTCEGQIAASNKSD